jgi:hypothetical protein
MVAYLCMVVVTPYKTADCRLGAVRARESVLGGGGGDLRLFVTYAMIRLSRPCIIILGNM